MLLNIDNMATKLTKKQHFLSVIKKVSNFRGHRSDILKLYKKYLQLSKVLTRRPRSTDFFPTTTCRNLNHYLERFWEFDDAKNELRKIQTRELDFERRAVANKKMALTFSLKSEDELKRIYKLKGCNYKDPVKMATRYNISVEEGLQKYLEKTERKVKNLKNTIAKMGGYKKEWSCKCVEYWIVRGYSEDEARIKIKEISPDTRSVESIMRRYDIEYHEALEYFNNVTEKGRKTFEKRPQHEKDEILLKRTKFSKKYSMASSKFFKKLQNLIKDLKEITVRVDDDEYFLWDYDNKKIYFYDFCIPELNFMVEYNGIMFHPRQKDTIFTTVEESVEKDNRKDKLAKLNGFDLYWYWENIDNESDRLEFYRKIIYKKYDTLKLKNNNN